MPRGYKLYLDDILDAIKKIESYTSGSGFEEFSKNGMVIVPRTGWLLMLLCATLKLLGKQSRSSQKS